jgi:hypothetical protein
MVFSSYLYSLEDLLLRLIICKIVGNFLFSQKGIFTYRIYMKKSSKFKCTFYTWIRFVQYEYLLHTFFLKHKILWFDSPHRLFFLTAHLICNLCYRLLEEVADYDKRIQASSVLRI